jgi:dolichyl-phosphate-mannose--protein O-mannosyl transferase
MYQYHYMIPLLIGCAAAGACLDICFSRFWAGFVACAVCIGAAVGFLLWSPLAFGTKQFSKHYVIWTSNWLLGDAYHRNLTRN